LTFLSFLPSYDTRHVDYEILFTKYFYDGSIICIYLLIYLFIPLRHFVLLCKTKKLLEKNFLLEFSFLFVLTKFTSIEIGFFNRFQDYQPVRSRICDFLLISYILLSHLHLFIRHFDDLTFGFFLVA
jgi:hypothetical protein